MHYSAPWWSLPPEKLFAAIDSSPAGLTADQVTRRRIRYGKNTVLTDTRRHGFFIFLNQFRSSLVLILLAAAAISFVLNETTEALVIAAIVVMSATLGFFQEYKAERTIRELRKLVSARTLVRRQGAISVIDVGDLVPGDVVLLERGAIVPADCRLLSIERLEIDEGPLTGESTPVTKSLTLLPEKTIPHPQNVPNMVFMGSLVLSGRADALVVTTGKATTFGQSAGELESPVLPGEFHRGLTRFANMLLIVTMSMTLFVFLANAVINQHGLLTSFLFAVALAVGITPEMLPIIITVALSRGATRMAKHKVITKQLASIEHFGNMDILCTDKTGTLTEGTLAVAHAYTVVGTEDASLLRLALLCNSVRHTADGLFHNPIDQAIWESPLSKSLLPTIAHTTFLAEREFSYTDRSMSVIVADGSNNLGIVKGAAETLLPRCTMTAEVLHEQTKQIVQWEHAGYKVIALATKVPRDQHDPLTENLTLRGYILFIDPPKKHVRTQFNALEALQVQVKIITGDSAEITRTIAQQVDLPIAHDRIITGEELERASDATFADWCSTYSVFARVSPDQKEKIVSCLQHHGHVVGFLGDGINDAPALHRADVGISVDTATGIAKEAADFIILQKDLSVLALGIKEGRRTFGNMTKYILNTISANFGNMMTVAIASLFLPFIPLLPVQILLNNFVSDIPMLFISNDRVDSSWIKKPKHWDIRFIREFMISFGLLSTFFDLLYIIPLMLWNVPIAAFRTGWFVESALSEIMITFSIRTSRPLFRSKPGRGLLVASIITGMTTLLTPMIPLSAIIFEFVPLPAPVLGYTLGVVIVYFISAEFLKPQLFQRFQQT